MKTTTVLALLSALGGLVVFAGGVWAIVRGIIRQTDATRENTRATDRLTEWMEKMASQVSDNTQRIAKLEGRRRG